MNARSVARAGILAALLAGAAWVTIPLGPVPFTLQTMVLAVIPARSIERPGAWPSAAICCWARWACRCSRASARAWRAIAGPTGGFLWGFLLGELAATTAFDAIGDRIPLFARTLAADAIMLAISYACGTVQLMVVAQLDVAGALALAVLPFVLPDAIKLVVGARIGCLVSGASPSVRRAGRTAPGGVQAQPCALIGRHARARGVDDMGSAERGA